MPTPTQNKRPDLKGLLLLPALVPWVVQNLCRVNLIFFPPISLLESSSPVRCWHFKRVLLSLIIFPLEVVFFYSLGSIFLTQSMKTILYYKAYSFSLSV